jgi:hypothetical protein
MLAYAVAARTTPNARQGELSAPDISAHGLLRVAASFHTGWLQNLSARPLLQPAEECLHNDFPTENYFRLACSDERQGTGRLGARPC